jgi:hypothetical protein
MPDPITLGTALSVAGPVLGAATNLFSMFSEARKEQQARRELDRLRQPFYKIQDEYFANQNLAESAAQQGMPTASMDYLTTETQRGLDAGITATQQGGGNVNNIANLMDVYNQSINKVAAQDATMQLSNIQKVMDANKDLAAQKNIQWGVNEFQPYQNKLKEITQRRGAAELNQQNFLQGAIGSVSALGTAVSGQELINSLFKGLEGGGMTNDDALAKAVEAKRLEALPTKNVQPKFGKFSSGGDGYELESMYGTILAELPGFQEYMSKRRQNVM